MSEFRRIRGAGKSVAVLAGFLLMQSVWSVDIDSGPDESARARSPNKESVSLRPENASRNNCIDTSQTDFSDAVAAQDFVSGFEACLAHFKDLAQRHIVESEGRETPTFPDLSSSDLPRIITGGYIFEGIHLSREPHPVTDGLRPGHVRINYKVGWEGQVYAGTRRCNWSVRDSSGSTIGESGEYVFASMQALPLHSSHTDVKISGKPASASVECSTERLDDPSGHYEFTNLRVRPTSHPTSDVDVVFDYIWVGSAGPSPQWCTARAYGRSGRLLGEQSYGFLTVETGPQTGSYFIDLEVVTEPPDSGAMQCVPLTAAAAP